MIFTYFYYHVQNLKLFRDISWYFMITSGCPQPLLKWGCGSFTLHQHPTNGWAIGLVLLAFHTFQPCAHREIPISLEMVGWGRKIHQERCKFELLLKGNKFFKLTVGRKLSTSQFEIVHSCSFFWNLSIKVTALRKQILPLAQTYKCHGFPLFRVDVDFGEGAWWRWWRVHLGKMTDVCIYIYMHILFLVFPFLNWALVACVGGLPLYFLWDDSNLHAFGWSSSCMEGRCLCIWKLAVGAWGH